MGKALKGSNSGRRRRGVTKCPHCGFEQPYTTTLDVKRYRDAIEKRLEDYGYPVQMNSQKYQAVTAIREIIAIRFGITSKSGGGMKPGGADKAIAALDEILPPTDKGEE